MKPRRHTQGREPRGMHHAPVVVTFEEHGAVADIVGDVANFVAWNDTAEGMLRRLHDLLVADGGIPETLNSVEVSEGRYADIHILPEGPLRHMVLLDASEAMRVLQARQQQDNEDALEHRALHRELKAKCRVTEGGETAAKSAALFRSSNLLGAVIREMRAPVAVISGHARLLADHLEESPAALQSVAAIRDALVRLDALSAAGFLSAGSDLDRAPTGNRDSSLHELAIYLQEEFQLQAELRGVEFEVTVAQRSQPVEIDFVALRHALLGLLVHALDVTEQKRLVVSLLHHSKGIDVELETSPCGFPAACFGALLTTRDLLYSNPGGSLPLAIGQQLLNKLSASIELVPAQAGGYVLWFQCQPQRTGIGGAA